MKTTAKTVELRYGDDTVVYVDARAYDAWKAAPVFAQDDPGEDEMYLNGPVRSFDPFSDTSTYISAVDVKAKLDAMDGKDVRVYINSPGGDAYEGAEIYSLFRAYPGKVTAVVMGVAASAGSVVISAADEIEMSPASQIMIHQAHAGLIMYVNADTLESATKRFGNQLRTADAAMAKVLAARMGNTEDEVMELLRAETWYTADQAIEDGLADRIMEERSRRGDKDREDETAPSARAVLDTMNFQAVLADFDSSWTRLRAA